MTTKQIFETGAQSHAINDIILFLDNTRFLAGMRDRKYKFIRELREGKPTKEDFYILFEASKTSYKREMPTGCKHLETLTEEQKQDFCRLYCEGYKQWEEENN